MATETHLEQIHERLACSVLNLGTIGRSGRYVTVNAAEAQLQFMVDGRPGQAELGDVVGGIVRNAAGNSANDFVFAFEEMVAF